MALYSFRPWAKLITWLTRVPEDTSHTILQPPWCSLSYYLQGFAHEVSLLKNLLHNRLLIHVLWLTPWINEWIHEQIKECGNVKLSKAARFSVPALPHSLCSDRRCILIMHHPLIIGTEALPFKHSPWYEGMVFSKGKSSPRPVRFFKISFQNKIMGPSFTICIVNFRSSDLPAASTSPQTGCEPPVQVTRYTSVMRWASDTSSPYYTPSMTMT